MQNGKREYYYFYILHSTALPRLVRLTGSPARGRFRPVASVQYALHRQSDELGRAKPQRRGQRVVLRLLGDHRVLEACAPKKKRPI